VQQVKKTKRLFLYSFKYRGRHIDWSGSTHCYQLPIKFCLTTNKERTMWKKFKHNAKEVFGTIAGYFIGICVLCISLLWTFGIVWLIFW